MWYFSNEKNKTNAQTLSLFWFPSLFQSMEVIRPKLDDLFYSTGNKKTTPDCPISVMPYYVPTATFHSYETAMTSACSEFTAVQRLPFFAEKFGPKYTEWSTTAREQLPGHHLEVSDWPAPAPSLPSSRSTFSQMYKVRYWELVV